MNAPAKSRVQLRFRKTAEKGWMGWTELPYNQKEIVEDILKNRKKTSGKILTTLSFWVSAAARSAPSPCIRHCAICTTTNCRKRSENRRNFTLKTTSIPNV
ncbi:MAG: hypothetical protein L6V85_08000 [Clostridiales bacterium]|nr:MAG: hypothetical protein L6V85_08000 [Clostridiales bacterium]